MVMLFLVYFFTILGQLHFTRNYFFTVNISAEQLLPQSNSFKATVSFSEQKVFGASIFSEHSLLLNSCFFKLPIIIWGETFNDQLLLVNGQLFRGASFSEQPLFRKTNLFRIPISTERLPYSKHALLQIIKFSSGKK